MIGALLAGRFELTGLLAESQLFSLYSGRDRLMGREVSLRLLKPPFNAEASFRTALAEAVTKAAMVQSPNVERLYELHEDGDEAFIVGDLTRAPSLADRIRKLAPFTSPVAVGSAIGITRGLDAFHKAGLVHGEVNSDNVVMMADGETKLQMGAIWEAYGSSQAAGSVVLPSLAPYLAPEVSSGGSPSKRSDVYAVGILLYELLTGRKPYVADTALATALRHSSDPTPRVRSISPSVPNVLDEIVYKAMAKEPSERYGHAGEMFLDLRQMQDAMRFGRTLSWPLKGQTVAQPQAVPSKQPVAPRMSAIREEAREREPRRARWESDVPLLMWIAGALGVGFLATVIGFYIVLNLDRPRLAPVPNLRGLSVSEAQAILKRMNLKFRMGAEVPNERFEADRIVDSLPEAGEKVPEGATVTVTLSAGSREVQVPELKGMTPDKARSILATENLSLDDQVDHAYDASVPDGTICRQDPAAQSKVERNHKIHVTVNSQSDAGNQQPTTPTDDADQWYNYTLSVVVEGTDVPVQVRIDITDEQGTKTFYDQLHQPGDRIETSQKGQGPQATFQIYYDDKLVKSYTKKATETTP